MLQGLGLFLKSIRFLLVGFDAWRLDWLFVCILPSFYTISLVKCEKMIWVVAGHLVFFYLITSQYCFESTTTPLFCWVSEKLLVFGGANCFEADLTSTIFGTFCSRKSVNHLEVGKICLEDDDCQTLADEWNCADECAWSWWLWWSCTATSANKKINFLKCWKKKAGGLKLRVPGG